MSGEAIVRGKLPFELSSVPDFFADINIIPFIKAARFVRKNRDFLIKNGFPSHMTYN